MAKSLGIRIPSGFDNPDSVDEAVLAPVTPSASLGVIVAGILASSAEAMEVMVDIEARKVYAVAAADELLFSEGTKTSVGTLEQDEDARSSPWKRAGSAGYTLNPPAGVTALETLVALPVKPSFSISSLISKIEDAVIAKDAAVPVDVLGIGGDNALIYVDQELEQVRVAKATDGNIGALRTAVHGLAEIEYEQIPAEEAEGAATLAFE